MDRRAGIQRLPIWGAAALCICLAACQSVGPSSVKDQTAGQAAAKGKRVLRFKRHNFEAHCYNTLSCSIIYDNSEFIYSYNNDKTPPRPIDFEKRWGVASYLDIRNFPPPAEVRWASLDAARHDEIIDIAEIFKD